MSRGCLRSITKQREDVISGVELRAHGHKLAWSLGDYLETLEEGFSHALMEEAKAKA